MNVIEYDSQGRMKYNPEFHENHRKAWSTSELAYLCSMHLGRELCDLSLALSRTESSLGEKIMELKRQGKYEYYRKLGKSI